MATTAKNKICPSPAAIKKTQAKQKPRAVKSTEPAPALASPAPPAQTPTASADPNAILPAKLAPDGPPINTYPATVPPSPSALLIASDGRPASEVKADAALSPEVLNALTAMNAASPSMGDLATVGLTAFVKVMASKVAAVAAGDMSGPEATAVAQIVTLDCRRIQMVVATLHQRRLRWKNSGGVRIGAGGICYGRRVGRL
jgi:hypothetical protein